jgi:hypothetical protein
VNERDVKVGVLILCRDEETNVGGGIAGFRAVLREVTVYVCENGSVG